MKESKNIIIIVLAIVLLGSLYFIEKKNGPLNKSAQNKEGVICGSTLNPVCHKYRCATGYLDPILIPPGGGRTDGTGLCNDGSNAENLGEVPN